MSPPFPSLTISTALEADLPKLAEINRTAYLPEAIFHFFFLNWPNEPAMFAFFLARITEKFNDPNSEVIKAIDTTTGEPVGFVCWTFVDKNVADPADEGNPAITESLMPGINQGFAGPSVTQFHRLEKKYSPDQYFTVKSLSILPQYQGKGIGSYILRHCMERADKAGLATHLTAFPSAHSLYLRFGFEEVERIDLDLNAAGPPNRGFGIYRMSSMLRKAKNKADLS